MYIYTKVRLRINCIFMIFMTYFNFEPKIIYILYPKEFKISEIIHVIIFDTHVVLVLLKIMYTITWKHQLCKTFFALEFKKGQDFNHGKLLCTCIQETDQKHLLHQTLHCIYSSWRFMIVATEKNVVDMGGSPHLQWFITVGLTIV